MKPTVLRTELSPSTKLRKEVSGGSRLKRFGLVLGLTLFAVTAGAEVVGDFKLDTFPGGNGQFTDDAGKGLRGLLGFPFSAPLSVAGPSGQVGDFAVSLDGSGALAADDSAAGILNFLTPPLTLECWVRSAIDTQTGRHRAFISYGIPGGPPVAGLVRGGYSLGLAPSGELRFTLYAVVDVLSGVPFPFDGQWHHVAAAYSIADGNVHFYLDGAEVALVPETRDITPPGSRHLDIGAFFTGLGRFDGDIDRVRISKAALTPAQLDSVAGAVKPVVSDTAVFYSFNEPNPPYQGQGPPPAGVAMATVDWVINHPPSIGASAGGPRASASGPAVVIDTPSGATGDLAVQFGGTDSSIDMAAVWDPNGVLNVDGDWTLEAWIKVSPDLERGVIFYYGHPGRGYSLSVNFALGNKLQVTTLGILDMPSDTAVVEADLWQHVAVAHKKGQSMTYFINGVQAGTRAYTGGTNAAQTTKILYIGAEWDGALPFTGFIDRVRISNAALTANQLDSNPLVPATPSQPPPPLNIARSQSNVIVSWPEASSAGYILEFSGLFSNWSPEPTTPVVVAGQKSATFSATGPDRYFRLKRP